MTFNEGYAYRSQIKQEKQTVLEYLTEQFKHSSKQQWQQRLQAGEVQLDGFVVSGKEKMRAGQWLIWLRPPWQEEDVPLAFEVVYQDEFLLVVAKPSGLPTMPAGGFFKHTLLRQVRLRWPHASPMHRLGRGTSGLVLFSLQGRPDKTGSALTTAIRDHEVKKVYLALASGVAQQDFYQINIPIGPVYHPLLGQVFAASATGKPSVSKAKVLERRSDSTLFEVEILSGRPHQIRIHLASVGLPLLGDPLYGVGGLPLGDQPALPGDGGYLLHAYQLGFIHPITGKCLNLQAKPPPELWHLQA